MERYERLALIKLRHRKLRRRIREAKWRRERAEGKRGPYRHPWELNTFYAGEVFDA